MSRPDPTSLSDVDLAWLAGLLEGEGSFMKPTPSDPTQPRITLHMTDLDVVERAAKLMGVIAPPWATRKEKPHHKQAYVISLKGWRASELMRQLRPLMGERRGARIDEILAGPTGGKPIPMSHGVTRYKKGCRCATCGNAKRAEYLRRVAYRPARAGHPTLW